MRERLHHLLAVVLLAGVAYAQEAVVQTAGASSTAESCTSPTTLNTQPTTLNASQPSTLNPQPNCNLPAWKTPTYTLVARGMDLRTALNTFAVAQGLSIVMSEAVQGAFSGDFRDVPCVEFLERLATVHNLSWYYDGAALYVYGAGEIRTILLDLMYMKAGEVQTMLRELGVEDARFPIRKTSNDELILVSGPPRYVALVSETIARADKLREMRTTYEMDVRLFPLKYTWADDVSFGYGTGLGYSGSNAINAERQAQTIRGVASLVQDIMNNTGSKGRAVELVDGQDVAGQQQQGGAGGGPNADKSKIATEGQTLKYAATGRQPIQPIVRAENRLNAVLVRDVKSRMPVYERIISELDVPQKLVEISVTTVELSREDALDWQLSLSYSTTHGHSTFGVGQNADNLFSPDGLGGKGLSGALTHIHSSYALATSLTALRQKGKARNISRTSLLTINNLAAQLTDTQSYHARVIGTEVASLETVSAGTRLTIKPRVAAVADANATNQVWLTLELEDGGFDAVSVDSMPMSHSSTLQTQTSVREGDSIMLAGYLRDIVDEAGWGIPYLRDIPYIGWLFGGASHTKQTVQRMFILTPYVIDLDEEMLTSVQSTRLRDISREEDLEIDVEDEDLRRRMRELEKDDIRQRRRERADEELERREAELKHEKKMRKLEGKRKMRLLSEDIRAWKRQELEAAQQLEQPEQPEQPVNADVHPVMEEQQAQPVEQHVEPVVEEAVEEATVEEEPVEEAKVEEEAVAEEQAFDGMHALGK